MTDGRFGVHVYTKVIHNKEQTYFRNQKISTLRVRQKSQYNWLYLLDYKKHIKCVYVSMNFWEKMWPACSNVQSQTQSISASVIQAHEEIDSHSVKRHLHDLAETNFKHIEFNM